MKRTIYFPLFLISLLTICLLIYVTLRNRSNSIGKNDLMEQTFLNKYWLELESGSVKLNDCILYSYTGNQITYLHEIVEKSHVLVLRFSETNCNICIDTEVENLLKFSKKVDSVNIVLIGSYSNERARWMRKSKFKIFNLRDQVLGLPLDDQNVPYYFILDEDLSAKSVFIPFKELPGLTEKYFELIYKISGFL